MKIENLKEKMIFKNYKDLCNILEIEVKGGRSKQFQIKELERYCKFYKKGNKFIIDEIYEEVKDKIDNRGKSEGSRGNNKVKYLKTMQISFLGLLARNSGNLKLTKNQIFKELYMINKDYKDCYKYLKNGKLCKYLDVKFIHLKEFYEFTNDTLSRNLDSLFKELTKNKYITLEELVYVRHIKAEVVKNKQKQNKINKTIKYDRFDNEIIKYEVKDKIKEEYRQATDREKQIIEYVQEQVLKNFHCKNEQEIISRGAWSEYVKSKEQILIEKANIDLYYTVYKIIYNKEHITEKLKYFLKEIDFNFTYNKLNELFICRLRENTNKRHQKESINKNLKHRKDIDFLDNHEKFLDKLVKVSISNEKINIITEDVKKQIIEESDMKKYELLNY